MEEKNESNITRKFVKFVFKIQRTMDIGNISNI